MFNVRLYAAPAAALAVLGGAHAATLTVAKSGGAQFSTIAAAVAASADGDIIQVHGGRYPDDFAEITTRIALVAVHGRVTMAATENLPNGKAILITDTDVSITGFNFVGARLPRDAGQNGAGIRYQGGNLVLTQCYFHNNQEGLLGGPDPAGSITIVDSEFAFNGDRSGPGSGYTHNLYAGAVALLDIEGSYFHDANVGHEIKSRALTTMVNNSRVVDRPTGTASYSIDLPNGGAASITNDQIEQGPLSQNGIIISYGEEGGIYAGSSLSVRDTLIENDLAGWSLGLNNLSNVTAALTGLQVYGLTTAQLAQGPVSIDGLTFLVSEPVISTLHPF